MRVITTLLIALSAVATARAQSNIASRGYYGQQYAQPSAQQYQQVPRSYYSGGSYSRSTYPPRATYSRSAYPPGYAPAYSYHAYPQQSYSYGQNPNYGHNYGQASGYHSYPQQQVNPQAIASQPQVQQPQFGAGFGTTFTDRVRQQANPQTVNPQVVAGTPQQPQFGAGFGSTFTDQVQQSAQQNARRQQAADQRKNEERWRQYQIQQSQQQAYFQRVRLTGRATVLAGHLRSQPLELQSEPARIYLPGAEPNRAEPVRLLDFQSVAKRPGFLASWLPYPKSI